MEIRQPIIVLVGHVDHGKSSILESIREISITKKEAGGITQKISSIDIPIGYVKKLCGDLLKQIKVKITIPGFLFIDTPGHAAFTNLRKRGGNLADIAILVVDINEGVKPQTLEAIEILRSYKTPFVVALNKVDRIPGWLVKNRFLLQNIKSQPEHIQKELDIRLYNIVGKLYELNLQAERFDRVEDYTKQIALIPCSAKTKEGLAELLMFVTGLAQRYLEQKLRIHVKGAGVGTILEVREEKGVGTILDTILYDGKLSVNDVIAIGGVEDIVITKVRSLFLQENNKPVKMVSAAASVKILAPNIKEVIAGMPLRVADNNLEQVKEEIKKEIEDVLIETDKDGIIIKADSLGSLEALTNLLKERGIKIKRASIGNISKKDVAEAVTEKDELNRAILGFNVKGTSQEVKVLTSDIIYRLIENFEKWQGEERKNLEVKQISSLVMPCKIKVLQGYIFRQSNPAVVGVEVIVGKLRKNMPIMKDGREITLIKGIQYEKKDINEAEAGKEVAVSLPNVSIGRQVREGDVLYSSIPEDDFKKLKKLKRYLNEAEVELLKEIALIKRKANPLWGA